jgi:two-component system, chemotaxis family, CheB/CheR fusion protein
MVEKADKASHLVVLGSSAGGIEALTTVLGSLPASFPAAVVLAQHVDPARPSYLGSILERKTALPVVLVEKATLLEHGKVYLVPANQHVVIDDGQVNMEGHHANRPRPSVDLLLTSAAKAYGERLVAVILTGSGSDGAAGAVDVKTAGGTVVIQNPATAAHPSMPLALPPTVVDHVADLDGMGPLLQGLVADDRSAEAEHGEHKQVLPELLDMVSRHTAIDFQSYKPTTILRRVGRRMAVSHTANLQEYLAYVKAHREELGELARSFLIKVTEFFRDPEAFECIKRDILPHLIEAGAERGRVLRLWSAGCATGEEAYSLAMMASEALGADLPQWNLRIFATDLDESAVNFARRGLYPANVLRYVPDGYRQEFFEPAGPGYRVKKAVRQNVIFGHQDLARGAPFPRIDLVVCRNLLIYFKPELQQDLLDLFAYALHQTAGYLFLGKAETARPARASFDLVNKKWKVYRCLSGPLAPATSGRALAAAERARRAPDRPMAGDGAALIDSPVDVLHLRRLNELVLRYLPTGVVLVDRSYRILSVNATARRLLGVRDVATEQDFLHTVRSLPYGSVRDGIDRVFRDKAAQTLPDLELEAGAGGAPRFVTLHVAPIHADGGSVDTVVVSILETTDLVEVRRRVEEMQAEQRHLVDDLNATNTRLKHTNDELQDANEELQGANEELLLAQEELQATNEEFEATNEELQATNEELETNNEELQATNEELEATNEELTARTSDLQDLAHTLGGERSRLSELVRTAPATVMVLRGADLKIDTANTRAGGFPGGTQVIGRTLAEVCTTPDLREVLEGARTAFQGDHRWVSGPVTSPWEGETKIVFSVEPTHDAAGTVSGVVVYGYPVV